MRKKKKPKIRRKPNLIMETGWIPLKEMGLVHTDRHMLVVECQECHETWDVELYFDRDTPITSYLCPNRCNQERLELPGPDMAETIKQSKRKDNGDPRRCPEILQN